MKHRQESSELRPTQADFDPYGGCLDALNAWEHFGGLSPDEALEKFRQAPEYFQEDFMFMGGAAFAYYFAVLERYILESSVKNDDDWGVEAIWILAHCIKMQFEAKTASHVNELRQRVIDLSGHVRSNLAKYSRDWDEQNRIDKEWQELETRLLSPGTG